jgi:hypothetical protein
MGGLLDDPQFKKHNSAKQPTANRGSRQELEQMREKFRAGGLPAIGSGACGSPQLTAAAENSTVRA